MARRTNRTAPPPKGAGDAGSVAVTSAPPPSAAVLEVTPPVEGARPDDAEPGEQGGALQRQPDDSMLYPLREGDILVVRAIDPTGFRRAGRHWPGTEETAALASDFTEAQLAALLSEPQLEVRIETRSDDA